jgi:hypothetical protein
VSMFRRNTYLWTIVVIGAIVTTVGGTGIFAVFTDRATQGPNTFQSGAQASAADLQIADWSPLGCGEWQEDLTTALWSATNIQPGDTTSRQLCLKNNGAAAATVSFTTLDLVQSDVECTGDEVTVDPSCALPGQIGELAGLLEVDYQVDADCDTILGEDGEITGNAGLLSALGGAPAALTTASGAAAGSTMCLSISVVYPSTTSLADVQAAQSDSVTWKFAFDAVAIE